MKISLETIKYLLYLCMLKEIINQEKFDVENLNEFGVVLFEGHGWTGIYKSYRLNVV